VVLIRKPAIERVPGEPWQGKTAAGDPDRTSVRALFKDFGVQEVDGDRVKVTDQRCLIAPDDLDDVIPTTADQIEDDDGTVFAIMHVGQHRPGTRAFRYALQLRA
jgi:hypothetical protein